MKELYTFFETLRKEHDFAISIEEYCLVLKAISLGFGRDSDALKRLCQTIWMKSSEQKQIFDIEFEKIILPIWKTKEKCSPLHGREKISSKKLREDKPIIGSTKRHNPTIKAISIGKNLEQKIQALPKKFLWQSRHLPFSDREVKQYFRRLRKLTSQGVHSEIDITQTAKKIARIGYFVEPILKPRKSNQLKLFIFIHYSDSMIPFLPIVKGIVQSIQRGGNLFSVKIYSFEGKIPSFYKEITKPRNSVLFTEVKRELTQNIQSTKMIIISDTKFEEKFKNILIREWCQIIPKKAWLNPLPQKRWDINAVQISRQIPMFEISRKGLKCMISTLK